jgi:hypothetical protein
MAQAAAAAAAAMTDDVDKHSQLLCLKDSILGFDLDHALLRYKQLAVARLIFDTLKAHMVANGYETIAHAPYDASFLAKGVLFDMKLGNVIKLTATKHVECGFHGTGHALTAAELDAAYGNVTDSELENFDGEHTVRARARSKSRLMLSCCSANVVNLRFSLCMCTSAIVALHERHHVL